MLRNTDKSWGLVARGLHWLLAVMIIGTFAYGYWANDFAPSADRFFHRSIHANIGYVVILLIVVRLIWRAMNPSPALPAGTASWEKIASRISHVSLYLLALLVALLGWAHSGAATPGYASWFGLFNVPQFTSPDRVAAHDYEERHITMAYVLIALVAVHILASLYHHFIKRDRTLMRMIDGKPD